MPTITGPRDCPFLVEISGAGFRHAALHATRHAAYTAARAIRERAQAGEPVVFTDRFGHTGVYLVLRIAVLRRNPLTGTLLSHARNWRRNAPAEDALTTLPDDWHDEPLPAQWRTP
ncbi:hypothetical protein [Streptomyces sp. XH2]|uniref:hypothetical protein n=1 Tax=Streptomyces sp. XH2 TaxID=3412483 RepID=UPI003C79E548